MNKEFCTYEQALALKELGFDEPCFLGYKMEDLFELFTKGLVYNSIYETFNETTNLSCTAPLYQQAFRWFREKHELVVDWNHSQYDNAGSYIGVSIKNIHLEETVVGVYKTYEAAESDCLDKLLEIVKNI